MRIFKFEELVAVLARVTRTLSFSLSVGKQVYAYGMLGSEVGTELKRVKCVLVSVTRCEYIGHDTSDKGVYLK